MATKNSSFLAYVQNPSLLFIQEQGVGAFESQQYLDLETRVMHPDADIYTAKITALLGESANDLVICCADTVDHIDKWFEEVNAERLWMRLLFWRDRNDNAWEDGLRNHEDTRDRLQRILDEFKKDKRCASCMLL